MRNKAAVTAPCSRANRCMRPLQAPLRFSLLKTRGVDTPTKKAKPSIARMCRIAAGSLTRRFRVQKCARREQHWQWVSTHATACFEPSSPALFMSCWAVSFAKEKARSPEGNLAWVGSGWHSNGDQQLGFHGVTDVVNAFVADHCGSVVDPLQKGQSETAEATTAPANNASFPDALVGSTSGTWAHSTMAAMTATLNATPRLAKATFKRCLFPFQGAGDPLIHEPFALPFCVPSFRPSHALPARVFFENQKTSKKHIVHPTSRRRQPHAFDQSETARAGAPAATLAAVGRTSIQSNTVLAGLG